MLDFLKEIEQKQCQTGRVNADSKAKKMGKIAKGYLQSCFPKSQEEIDEEKRASWLNERR